MTPQPDPVRFDGPCPFLSCADDGPHEHAVCATCRTIRHANIFGCADCLAIFNAERAAEGLEPLTGPAFGGAR